MNAIAAQETVCEKPMNVRKLGGGGGGGGRGAQSVERATAGEEEVDSIPAPGARSLVVGSVSVQCDRLRQKSWRPSVLQHLKLFDVSLETRVRDSLVAYEDVKEPMKQTKVRLHITTKVCKARTFFYLNLFMCIYFELAICYYDTIYSVAHLLQAAKLK